MSKIEKKRKELIDFLNNEKAKNSDLKEFEKDLFETYTNAANDIIIDDDKVLNCQLMSFEDWLNVKK